MSWLLLFRLCVGLSAEALKPLLNGKQRRVCACSILPVIKRLSRFLVHEHYDPLLDRESRVFEALVGKYVMQRLKAPIDIEITVHQRMNTKP